MKPDDTIYHGVRLRTGAHVTRTTDEGGTKPLPLEPSRELRNHGPTGFEWGYGGSGPAQLALALLADYLGDDNAAVPLHQDFKHAVITRLDQRGWTLTSEQIRAAIDSLRAQTGTPAAHSHE